MSAAELGLWTAAHLVALVALPVVVVGVVNRTKALWSGRRGLPVLQLLWDLRRLAHKRPVYSDVSTAVFRVGPWVVLGTALCSGLVVPLLGGRGPIAFRFDFVWFAYVGGLGRIALMLAALDTGSAFEGMGTSREATYAAIVEPALFLVVGALCLTSGARDLAGALALRPHDGGTFVTWFASIVALFIVVQVEAARVPVDDPSTHLELTMIHEVMILDHSGRDLAALQLGAAMKLTMGLAVVAALVNPWPAAAGAPAGALGVVATVGLTLVLAVVVGTIESLVARLKLDAVPQYILVGLIAASTALLATTWQVGGAG